MSAERAAHRPDWVGCVLSIEPGVAVVLTDSGTVRASWGSRLLGQVARDRALAPAPGDWVVLRRWYDGPVTVESGCRTGSSDRPLATVLPWRRTAMKASDQGPGERNV